MLSVHGDARVYQIHVYNINNIQHDMHMNMNMNMNMNIIKNKMPPLGDAMKCELLRDSAGYCCLRQGEAQKGGLGHGRGIKGPAESGFGGFMNQLKSE